MEKELQRPVDQAIPDIEQELEPERTVIKFESLEALEAHKKAHPAAKESFEEWNYRMEEARLRVLSTDGVFQGFEDGAKVFSGSHAEVTIGKSRSDGKILGRKMAKKGSEVFIRNEIAAIKKLHGMKEMPSILLEDEEVGTPYFLFPIPEGQKILTREVLESIPIEERMDIIDQDILLLHAIHQRGVLHGDRSNTHMGYAGGRVHNFDLSGAVLLDSEESCKAHEKAESEMLENSLSQAPERSFGLAHARFITHSMHEGIPLDEQREWEQEGYVVAYILTLEMPSMVSGWQEHFEKIRRNLKGKTLERFERLVGVLRRMAGTRNQQYKTGTEIIEALGLAMSPETFEKVKNNEEEKEKKEMKRIENLVARFRDSKESISDEDPFLQELLTAFDSTSENAQIYLVEAVQRASGGDISHRNYAALSGMSVEWSKRLRQKASETLMKGKDEKLWNRIWDHYFDALSKYNSLHFTPEENVLFRRTVISKEKPLPQDPSMILEILRAHSPLSEEQQDRIRERIFEEKWPKDVVTTIVQENLLEGTMTIRDMAVLVGAQKMDLKRGLKLLEKTAQEESFEICEILRKAVQLRQSSIERLQDEKLRNESEEEIREIEKFLQNIKRKEIQERLQKKSGLALMIRHNLACGDLQAAVLHTVELTDQKLYVEVLNALIHAARLEKPEAGLVQRVLSLFSSPSQKILGGRYTDLFTELFMGFMSCVGVDPSAPLSAEGREFMRVFRTLYTEEKKLLKGVRLPHGMIYYQNYFSEQ